MLFLPLTVLAKVPNDPNLKQWSYTDVNVENAWDITTGSRSVVVAVIDNGFDTYHPDLVGNVWHNPGEIEGNGIDDDQNGYIDDIVGWNFVPTDTNKDGVIDERETKGNNDPRPDVSALSDRDKQRNVYSHGTVIAGIIGARGNNGVLGTGINWQIQLMNIKVVGNEGSGEAAPVPEAIHYAVDNGADIINISMVSDEHRSEMTEAINYAYSKGVALVAAAGNESRSLVSEPRYPVCSDTETGINKVLGVSAIDESHRLAPFSNYGIPCIDLTAPGVNISSIVRTEPNLGLTEQYRDHWNGTSFAAPFVTGAAALVKSVQPAWGASQIYEALLASTHKTPPEDELAYQTTYGAGLLQIDKAVKYAFDRIPKIVALKDILFFQGNDTTVRGLKNAAEKISVPVSLKAAYDITSFGKDENKKYAAVVPDGEGVRVIIYNSTWQENASWKIDMHGPVYLLLANIQGDSIPEVVVSPRYPSQELFRVYGLEGNELGRYTASERPRKSFVATRASDGETTTPIYVLTVGQKSSTVYRFDTPTTVSSQVTLPGIRSSYGFAVVDTDTDGKEEYILVRASLDKLWLRHFGSDGSLLNTFEVYPNTESLTSLEMISGDYDGDKKDDIILTSRTGSMPISVWNGEGKKIMEKKIQNTKTEQSIHLFLSL